MHKKEEFKLCHFMEIHNRIEDHGDDVIGCGHAPADLSKNAHPDNRKWTFYLPCDNCDFTTGDCYCEQARKDSNCELRRREPEPEPPKKEKKPYNRTVAARIPAEKMDKLKQIFGDRPNSKLLERAIDAVIKEVDLNA